MNLLDNLRISETVIIARPHEDLENLEYYNCVCKKI